MMLERFEDGARTHCKRLNSAARCTNIYVGNLKFRKIELNPFRLIGYSDAAFAKNGDSKHRPSRIILIMDKKLGNTTYLQSYESRRVACPFLSAEVIESAILFDDCLTLKSKVEQTLQRPLLMHLSTDSKSLLKIISEESNKSEKPKVFDINTARGV